MNKPLRRDAIYKFIVCYAAKHRGNTPSTGKIAKKFKICRSAAYWHTKQLETEGRVKRIDGELVIVGSKFQLPRKSLPRTKTG